LRRLGAFEQVFHLYVQHNPTHFSLAIRISGLNIDRAEKLLLLALTDLQAVHPQLAAGITNPGPGHERALTALLHRTNQLVPMAVAPAGTKWEEVMADEQTRRFDGDDGPLWRATRPCPVYRPSRPGTSGSSLGQ